VVGFLLILTVVVTLSAFEPWEEWHIVVLGGWRGVSCWVLERIAAVDRANFVVVGAAELILAVYEILQVRKVTPPAS
jgi:hypothetical protein